MAGYKNFQTDKNKHTSKLSTKSEELNQNNKRNQYETKDEKFDKQMDKWVSFWRANIHRFAQDMGVRLYTFQKILLYLMDKFPMFMYIASRGTSKSFLIALYAILRCILYPDTTVVISASTKGQGILMMSQYIKSEFYNKYPLIRNEIEDINEGVQRPECIFKNKSKIIVVTPSDNARGNRTNILILEEFPTMKKDIIDAVLKKFATSPRTPPFMDKEPYKSTYPQELNRELYISSARYKAEWGWQKTKDFMSDMIKDGNNFYHGVFATDYTLPLKEGIYVREKIKRDMESAEFNAITWSMEMETMWFGENEDCYFSLKDFNKNREIMNAIYPHEHERFLEKNKKKFPKPIDKKENEVHVLAIDVAVTNKEDSDNTIISFIKARESGDGYIRQLKYIEAINGEKITEQALRIKQLWYDFNVDYIVLDIRNCGIDLYDMLTKTTNDTMRYIEYPAMACMNDEDYAERAYEKDALLNVYSIAATQDLNDMIAKNFRNTLQSGKLKLLIQENEASNMFQEKDEKYREKPIEERLQIESPYIQTTISVNEIINTEYKVISGKIKIIAVGRARKDRYSSISYGNYFISELEAEKFKDREAEEDLWMIVM